MLLFKVAILVAGISSMLGPLLNTFVLLIVYAVIYGVTTGTCLIIKGEADWLAYW